MINTAILACDGVTNASLGVTLDILSAANRIASELRRPPRARFAFQVLGLRRTIITATGNRLQADATISRWSEQRADIVLVAGLNLPTKQELLVALATRDLRSAIAWLRTQWLCGATLGASCTSTFLLAEAGLLEGKTATTSWFHAPLFRSRYPGVNLRSDLMLTCAERLLCAGAAMAQADLVLTLVAEKVGSDAARLCMRYLLLDERSSQGSYASMQQLAAQDNATARAQAWVQRHIAEDFTISDLANAMTLGSRTLARRIQQATGASPIAFVQSIRVESALNLLRTSALPFDEIAARVGYLDPGALRRVLRRETGLSVSDARKAAAAQNRL